jgi:hypothetical protein
MNKIALYIAMLLIVFSTIEASEHFSYNVTPENIKDMNLDFEISCKRINKTLIGFSMIASSGKSTLSTRTDCDLEIFQDGKRIVSCQVESVRASGVVSCDFMVGEDLISSAYLHFRNRIGHSHATEEFIFKVGDFRIKDN